MKAPIQEVEGRLQDVHVRGAALPTQLAHCKRREAPAPIAQHSAFNAHQHSHFAQTVASTDHFSLGDQTQTKYPQYYSQ